MTTEKGFTLIELLVVVAIIGILAAVAIPQFAAHRDQAFCASVVSDVKNTVIEQEGIFAQTQAYSNVPIKTTHGTKANNIVSAMNATGTGIVTGSSTAGCAGKTLTYDQAAGTYNW